MAAGLEEERSEGIGGESDASDWWLGFDSAGATYIPQSEMTILPIEFDEITTPATAEKNGRSGCVSETIGRPTGPEL